MNTDSFSLWFYLNHNTLLFHGDALLVGRNNWLNLHSFRLCFEARFLLDHRFFVQLQSFRSHSEALLGDLHYFVDVFKLSFCDNTLWLWWSCESFELNHLADCEHTTVISFIDRWYIDVFSSDVYTRTGCFFNRSYVNWFGKLSCTSRYFFAPCFNSDRFWKYLKAVGSYTWTDYV